jgi:hypothetical protein
MKWVVPSEKSASAGVITDFLFALTTWNLIAEFEVRAATFHEILTTLLQKIQTLRQMLDLLPRLLSGSDIFRKLERTQY